MNRIHWLDSARGFGIILVVFGHALGGLIDSPLGINQNAFRQMFFAIYTYHMPLFFLLSGLLVTKRLENGPGPFLRALLPTIVWPYFLWSVIQFTIIYGLGTLVNRPADSYWPVILSLPWNTVSQFWFLYALFWMHILAVLLVPRIGREGFVLFALALKALALVLILPVPIKLVSNHMLFYAIGVWLMTGGLELLVIKRGIWIKLVVLPCLAAATLIATLNALPSFGADLPLYNASSPEIANLAWRFPTMAAAVLCVLATVGIASMTQISGSRLLLWLGRMTMPIFVLHVMFLAGTRIILTRSGILTDPVVILIFSVFAGLIGPIIVERCTRFLGLNRWIGFQ